MDLKIIELSHLPNLPAKMSKICLVQNPSNWQELMVMGSEQSRDVYTYNMQTQKYFKLSKKQSYHAIGNISRNKADKKKPMGHTAIKINPKIKPNSILSIGGRGSQFYEYNTKTYTWTTQKSHLNNDNNNNNTNSNKSKPKSKNVNKKFDVKWKPEKFGHQSGCRAMCYKSWIFVCGSWFIDSNILSIFKMNKEWLNFSKLVKKIELPFAYFLHGCICYKPKESNMNRYSYSGKIWNDHIVHCVLFGGFDDAMLLKSFVKVEIDLKKLEMYNNKDKNNTATTNNKDNNNNNNDNGNSSNNCNDSSIESKLDLILNEPDDADTFYTIVKNPPEWVSKEAPNNVEQLIKCVLINKGLYFGFSYHLIFDRYLLFIGGKIRLGQTIKKLFYLDLKYNKWYVCNKTLPYGIHSHSSVVLMNNIKNDKNYTYYVLHIVGGKKDDHKPIDIHWQIKLKDLFDSENAWPIEWQIERLIWIAYFNNDKNNKCLLNQLNTPKDIIHCILKFLKMS